MKKFTINKKVFTLNIWTIETPIPKKKKEYRYHHLSITDCGVFFDGTLLVKGKLKLVQ